MADVQLEDGYTRIANEILEECAKRKFNGTQLRILMIVWRYTYGFGRKDHEMSLSFFAKACNMGKTQLDREISALIDANVLMVTQESSYTKPRKIGFNKNYEEWKTEDSQRFGGQSAKKLTVSEKDGEQSANKRTPTVSKKADQERKYFKENIKENTTTIGDDFEKVFRAYCEIHGKAEHQAANQMHDIDLMLNKGIPADMIISVMAAKHEEKKRKGDQVHSFSYYHDAIIQTWEGMKKVEELKGRTSGIQFGGTSPTRPEDSITGGQLGWIGRGKKVVQMPNVQGRDGIPS